MKKVIIAFVLIVSTLAISLFGACSVFDKIDDAFNDILGELESEVESKEEPSNPSSEKDSSQNGTEDKESSQVGINPDDITLYSPVVCGHIFSSQIFYMFPFYYDNVKEFPGVFEFRVICNRIGYDFTVYETPTGMCFYNVDMKHSYNVSFQNLSSGFLLNNELLGIPDSDNIEISDITHWGAEIPYYQFYQTYPLYVKKFN